MTATSSKTHNSSVSPNAREPLNQYLPTPSGPELICLRLVTIRFLQNNYGPSFRTKYRFNWFTLGNFTRFIIRNHKLIIQRVNYVLNEPVKEKGAAVFTNANCSEALMIILITVNKIIQPSLPFSSKRGVLKILIYKQRRVYSKNDL